MRARGQAYDIADARVIAVDGDAKRRAFDFERYTPITGISIIALARAFKAKSRLVCFTHKRLIFEFLMPNYNGARYARDSSMLLFICEQVLSMAKDEI